MFIPDWTAPSLSPRAGYLPWPYISPQGLSWIPITQSGCQGLPVSLQSDLCPLLWFSHGPRVGEGRAHLSQLIITFPVFLPASSSSHRPTSCWDSSFWCTRMKQSFRDGSFVVVAPRSMRPRRVPTAWSSGAPASYKLTSLLCLLDKWHILYKLRPWLRVIISVFNFSDTCSLQKVVREYKKR